MTVLRGALVEYGMSLLGPIPNVVVFQFNPEQIVRTIQSTPAAAATAETSTRGTRRAVETGQTAAPPVETFTVTAHFSAADDLGAGGAAAARVRHRSAARRAREDGVPAVGASAARSGRRSMPSAARLSGGALRDAQRAARTAAAHPVHLGLTRVVPVTHPVAAHHGTEVRPSC
jgi:hypothetical protein